MAAAAARLCGDVAARASCDAEGEREPESRSVASAVCRFAAHSRFEDRLVFLCGYAWAVIGDADQRFRVAVGERDLDSASSVVAGVFEQWLKYPVDEFALERDAHWRRRQVNGD